MAVVKKNVGLKKGIVVVSPFWTNLFSAGKASAVTIFPFIFLQSESFTKDLVLLNHERIHIKQAIELMIIPFYIWYLLEFLIRYSQFRNFRRAYYNISFEREAYRNQNNINYCEGRKVWGFLKYLKEQF